MLYCNTCSGGQVRCSFWFVGLVVSMKNPNESLSSGNSIVYALS